MDNSTDLAQDEFNIETVTHTMIQSIHVLQTIIIVAKKKAFAHEYDHRLEALQRLAERLFETLDSPAVLLDNRVEISQLRYEAMAIANGTILFNQRCENPGRLMDGSNTRLCWAALVDEIQRVRMLIHRHYIGLLHKISALCREPTEDPTKIVRVRSLAALSIELGREYDGLCRSALQLL